MQKIQFITDCDNEYELLEILGNPNSGVLYASTINDRRILKDEYGDVLAILAIVVNLAQLATTIYQIKNEKCLEKQLVVVLNEKKQNFDNYSEEEILKILYREYNHE